MNVLNAYNYRRVAPLFIKINLADAFSSRIRAFPIEISLSNRNYLWFWKPSFSLLRLTFNRFHANKLSLGPKTGAIGKVDSKVIDPLEPIRIDDGQLM